MNTKSLIGIIIIIALAIGGYFAYARFTSAPGAHDQPLASSTSSQSVATSSPALTALADVNFICDGKKTLHAVYFPAQVIIELSDGRALQLPQTATTTKGVEYSNTDHTFVFSSMGPTAFFAEHGSNTYDKCVQVDTTDVEGAGAN